MIQKKVSLVFSLSVFSIWAQSFGKQITVRKSENDGKFTLVLEHNGMYTHMHTCT